MTKPHVLLTVFQVRITIILLYHRQTQANTCCMRDPKPRNRTSSQTTSRRDKERQHGIRGTTAVMRARTSHSGCIIQ